MPVALMFDGPSLGGFVCPCTITSSELWKMGQVSAKDTVLFKPLTIGAQPSPHAQKQRGLSKF
jgi:urea carboxylase